MPVRVDREAPPRLRVRELRKARGMTQMKLAAAADMHVAEISRIEHGHQDVKTRALLRLANALRVDVGELFPQPEAPEPPEPPDPRTGPKKVVRLMAQMPAEPGDMSSVATAWAGPGKRGLERLELLKDAAKGLGPEDGNWLTTQIAATAAWWGRLYELHAAGEIGEEEAKVFQKRQEAA